MGAMAQSSQNFMLSSASQDLGLGDSLSTQLQDQVAMQQKQKKRNQLANNAGLGNNNPLGLAALGTGAAGTPSASISLLSGF